ncbi:MAG TPA: hypothetical protein VFF50_04035 [Candidatus Deferrimicrobiaceae bacterium]|jgi:hypothetical protein|nr:hypothetical protein [Candidatus Deferrimicrobiaceae bacterium]
MRIPLWIKVVWTACVIAWVPLYWRQYGSQNFLFFCDLGNLFIAAALWLESALIFSWQATGLLVFQLLFTIDLAVAFVSGRHLIGGTEYMFDPQVPLPIRLLSLFHIVTPPLLLWAIHLVGYDPRGWKYQTVTAWIVVPINYLWRPQYDVNWARGLFFREQHAVPGSVYLMAYLIIVPALIYYPTHRLLRFCFAGKRKRKI